MRQNIAVPIVSAKRGERKKAFQLIGVQAIGVIIVALLWFLKGSIAAYAAFLGGAANLIPTFALTGYLFATMNSNAPKRMALTLFLGEFIKLLVSGLAVGMLIIRLPHEMIPILTGFAGALVALWMAPLIISIESNRDE